MDNGFDSITGAAFGGGSSKSSSSSGSSGGGGHSNRPSVTTSVGVGSNPSITLAPDGTVEACGTIAVPLVKVNGCVSVNLKAPSTGYPGEGYGHRGDIDGRGGDQGQAYLP